LRAKDDSAKGRVDFILAFPDRKIPIEIGYGKKERNQVVTTLSKIKGCYIAICESDLIKEEEIIKAPLLI